MTADRYTSGRLYDDSWELGWTLNSSQRECWKTDVSWIVDHFLLRKSVSTSISMRTVIHTLLDPWVPDNGGFRAATHQKRPGVLSVDQMHSPNTVRTSIKVHIGFWQIFPINIFWRGFGGAVKNKLHVSWSVGHITYIEDSTRDYTSRGAGLADGRGIES